jgi:hypothetical protein
MPSVTALEIRYRCGFGAIDALILSPQHARRPKGRHVRPAPMYDSKIFQSTPLREGRRAPTFMMRFTVLFQSTPLARGDLNVTTTAIQGDVFQSTPLREGRLPGRSASRPAIRFQSTPLREGRPGTDHDLKRLHVISIHAPARGATECRAAIKVRRQRQSG